VITLSNGIAATTNVETFIFYNVAVGIYIKACLSDPIFLLVSRDIEYIYLYLYLYLYRINSSSQKITQ
jgi:hypothetical protein